VNGKKEEKDEYNAMLHSMGIISPVTRKSAGSAYHVQLARQLSDFIHQLVLQCGGMMTLTDVYCIFNRARGTELISPDDLLHACELFATLNLHMKLRRFKSGVLVIQSQKHSDQATAQKILKLVASKGAISALELSHTMSISIILAREHLLASERLQYLCRDESMEGVRFYRNFFKSYVPKRRH